MSIEKIDLPDYKFFCFDELGFPSEDGREFPKPKVIDKAISLAEKLSNGIPYLRVDLYILGYDIYFGELTFFHGSGMEYTKPAEFDKITMGDWLNIPQLFINTRNIN